VGWLALSLGVTVLILLAALSQADDDAQAAHERADTAEAEAADLRSRLHAINQQVDVVTADSRQLVATVHAGLAREDQLVVMLRHMGLALQHSANDDWHLAHAVLGEVTTDAGSTE
jgi:hypothetical protein